MAHGKPRCDDPGSCAGQIATGPQEAERLPVDTAVCDGEQILPGLPRWISYSQQTQVLPSRHPAWLTVLTEGLKHKAYCIEAFVDGRLVGLLPLCYVRSLLFGRFLVSLPYLNSGGVLADNDDVAQALVDRAVGLADCLKVRHLELRHEKSIDHPALSRTLTSKVHMRLPLPGTAEQLWNDFDPKVRNQIRKGEKAGLDVLWGGLELLPDFYRVFARNMRDLGTPVFARGLFESVLRQFPDDAEICALRLAGKPVAAALLVHGRGVTEVPSASCLRSHNSTNANMLMYWHLLQRAVSRGQSTFDFGRSSLDSNTFRFKKQWGAQPEPAAWQYYVRRGDVDNMRRESGKYDRFVRIWQRLPVPLTRWIGPAIVRGIP
jgi:FemAB-related protein (PEP-CTERM system-associated)